MRPLFTIHAGEYLVGLYLQQQLKLNVWIPAKDTGIDLLVTDSDNRCTISLQVKYGKDFLPGKPAELREKLRCLSWFSLNRAKLEGSHADFWVFVLQGFKSDVPDFVVVPTPELRQRMTDIHGTEDGKLQSYFCSTENEQCWEVRAPRHNQLLVQVAEGRYEDPKRDFTQYLNRRGWTTLLKNLEQ